MIVLSLLRKRSGDADGIHDHRRSSMTRTIWISHLPSKLDEEGKRKPSCQVVPRSGGACPPSKSGRRTAATGGNETTSKGIQRRWIRGCLAALLPGTGSRSYPSLILGTVCLPLTRALSTKVDFVEIDLSEESPASSGGSVGDAAARMRMRRMEDAIRKVLIRTYAPYWVPPMPRPLRFADLHAASRGLQGTWRGGWLPPMPRPLRFGDLEASSRGGGASVLSEEAMCFTSVRGWPSAKYFVEGKFPHPVKRSRKYATPTDDEES